MTFVCLWNPAWATGAAALAELATALLAETPRVAVEARGVLWADARGLPAPRLAWSLLRRAGEWQTGAVRAGVAALPVAAALAARSGETPVTIVEAGHERAFLAPLPLELLEPERRLRPLLEGVGLRRCGELAALEREAVEVRFGAAGAALWRLARADDPRRLFGPIPWERPHASLDFVDYTIRDTERLAFTANALLASLCDTLRARGERARSLVLELPLSGGDRVRQVVRVALPTAERTVWLRRIREVLERLVLPDAVAGVSLQVEAAEAASATQGDLFDRGFATAGPVEEAIARLVDTHGELFVTPESDGHPLPERRTRWQPQTPAEATTSRPPPDPVVEPSLLLQLLPEPRRITVRVRPRRDHRLPLRYLDGGRWHELPTAAGPDRVSGGHWEERAYAREYFRCVTGEGRLVWLFRDAREDAWYLHGWWD